MTGDVDPRELAYEAVRDGDDRTDSQRFRAVRDWVMELAPEEARWLEAAVHSGRIYCEYQFTRPPE